MKRILLFALFLALCSLPALGQNHSHDSIERRASTVRIDSVGEVKIEPRSNKGLRITRPTTASTINFCADAGSTDAYACSLAPVITAYTTGQVISFKANTANTGAATINLNALGAKTIKKVAGGITTDLATNDIRAGQYVQAQYDGTNFQMLSAVGNADVVGTGDVVGPASASDNAIARYDSITGKLLQNSLATLGDSGEIRTSPAITNPLLPFFDSGIYSLAAFPAYTLTADYPGMIWGLYVGVEVSGTHGMTESGYLNGVYSAPIYSSTATGIHLVGFDSNPQVSNGSTITNLYGVWSNPQRNAGSTITNMYGGLFEPLGGGTVMNSYNVYIKNPSSPASITNNYGLYVNPHIGGTVLNYNIFSAGATAKNHLEGYLTIGGGTEIKKVLSATASLDFTALAANTCEELTITVTGAADGDTVSLGVPAVAANGDNTATFFGFVSAPDTVLVRRCNHTLGATTDPAAATVRATVTKF